MSEQVPTRDKLSASELAEQYGFAAAVLNSNGELRRLFQQATTGPNAPWSVERFTAKLRNTAWYRNSTESWRKTETLRLTDPKTYQQQLEQTQATVTQMAAAMGANVSGKTLTNLVNTAYRQGWTQEQLRAGIGQYVQVRDGYARGAAGEALESLKGTAWANGIRYSDAWYQNAVRQVATGARTQQDFENDIRQVAASAFPVFKDQIQAGTNVRDIASPYINSMGSLLEINENDIDLFDPTVRSALAGRRDPKTGQATAKSLWEFENDLRKDSRWAKTNNARQQTMGTVKQILESFGFQG